MRKRTPVSVAMLCAFVALVEATTRFPAVQETARPSTKRLIPSWTAVIDATGRCQYSVPPTWNVEDELDGPRIAWAPDGSASVHQAWSPSASWSSYTSMLRRTLKPTVVHQDTTHRFWVEHDAGWPGLHTFVAVPSSSGVCATQIDVKPTAIASLRPIIRQIIHSVVAFE